MTKAEQLRLNDLRIKMLGAKEHVDDQVSRRDLMLDYQLGSKNTLDLIAKWMDEAGFIAKNLNHREAQATACAVCGEYKHTPLRNDSMGGYVCLTCIDRELIRLQQQSRQAGEVET